ncbi:putative defense protein [Dysidea avara]|uniref:putative defense protein n=1 Tax=Dysidea avara TaxID=196820 RepID=UPI003333B203
MKVTLGYIIFFGGVMGFMAVEGRSTGAPPEACALIQPQHPSSPQTSPVPFSVDLSAFTGNTSTSYTPGQTYIITLRGGATNPKFIGFMIQAWLVADNSPVGKFASSGLNYQAQCIDDTAATHTDNNEKTLVALSWTAPPAGTGAISFRFAFVDDYTIYWDNIMTEVVSEAQALGISPSESAITTSISMMRVTGTISASAMVTPMPASTASISPGEMSTTAVSPTAMPSTASPLPSNIGNTGNSDNGSVGLMASTVLTLLLTVLLTIINN